MKNQRNEQAELLIALAYLAALTVAEVMTNLVAPAAGLLMHGLLLIALLAHAAMFAQERQQRFLLTMALSPLIRLMSLTLPLPRYEFVYWYAVVGAPLLLAAYLLQRVLRLRFSQVGVNGRGLFFQILVGVTGLGLGYIEYLILKPEPLAPELSWNYLWLPALILMVFTGFLEEWVFRGLLQYTAMVSMGRFGIIYGALVFAVLHIGYRSLLDFVFVFCVAVYFSLVVVRTHSIVGVTLAHGLTNIGLFLIFPFLVGGYSPTGYAPLEESNPPALVQQFLGEDIQGQLSPAASLPCWQTFFTAKTPRAPRFFVKYSFANFAPSRFKIVQWRDGF